MTLISQYKRHCEACKRQAVAISKALPLWGQGLGGGYHIKREG